MYCINSTISCTGCGECFDAYVECSACKKQIYPDEEYFSILGNPTCKSCVTYKKERAVCSYCGEDSKSALEASDITLCPYCTDRNTYRA